VVAVVSKHAAIETVLNEKTEIEERLSAAGASRDQIHGAQIEHSMSYNGRFPIETYSWYARWVDAGRPRQLD
jgi:hypothetical protein